jgi:RNA-directed DNA polymerase
MMLTKEQQIAERARKYKDDALHNLHHFIDQEELKEAYEGSKKKGASGVDGVTWYSYGENLEPKLATLLAKFREGSYRAPNIRRVYIPKDNKGAKRPLGIPTIEDKILQRAVSNVLTSIYEQEFNNCSYGFREGRSQHQAIDHLFKEVSYGKMRYIIDADIQNFFGEIDHGILRSFLDHRIKDGVIRKMIDKWLKAGIMESGQVSYPREGTPQGGVISPLLSNIYLHNVLDIWFSETIQPLLKGQSTIVRYADDFVLGFTTLEDAKRVLSVLYKRFAKFGLKLHPEKTKLVDLQTNNKDESSSFDFLGFTHYMGKSRKGYMVLKRKTSRKKFTQSLIKIGEWIKHNRHEKLVDLIAVLNVKLKGYYNYYGVTFNSRSIMNYYHEVTRLLIKWLRRRGGKHKSWEYYQKLIHDWIPIELPKIYHSFIKRNLKPEEPYAGKPLVRICGGAGR